MSGSVSLGVASGLGPDQFAGKGGPTSPRRSRQSNTFQASISKRVAKLEVGNPA
jgi:hypothetical protein